MILSLQQDCRVTLLGIRHQSFRCEAQFINPLKLKRMFRLIKVDHQLKNFTVLKESDDLDKLADELNSEVFVRSIIGNFPLKEDYSVHNTVIIQYLDADFILTSAKVISIVKVVNPVNQFKVCLN